MAKIIDKEELKQQLDPLEVLQFIGYSKSSPKKSGDEIRDYCPIHEGDKQRSLAIDSEKKTFFCHSCESKGDLIELYLQSKNVNFQEALRDLSNEFGICEREISNPKSIFKNIPTRSSANKIWEEATAGGDSPYLKIKEVNKCPGIKFGKDEGGNNSIIVPFYNIDGDLQTLQFINNKGKKFFLRGHSYKASFFALGAIKDDIIIYFTEGLATAITVWEALEKEFTVVSAGSANNIAPVVEAVRNKYKSIQIKLALDNGAESIIDKIAPPFSYSIPDFTNVTLSGEGKANDFNDLISKGNCSLKDVKSQLKKEIYPIKEKKEVFYKKIPPLTDQLKFRKEYYDEHGKPYFDGIPTGYTDLDKTPLLKESNLIVIAGRPAMGKTAFALNVLYNICFDQHLPVGFVSCEMTAKQLAERTLSTRTGIELEKINEGTFSKDDYEKLKEEDTKLQKANFFILDEGVEEISKIITKIQKLKESNDIKIVVIDYIQLLNSDKGSDNRQCEVAEISRSLKRLAMEIKTPIIIISQLSRKVEERASKQPLMSDLRDSGQLEQDADVIITLYRREYYDPNDKPGTAEVKVLKNRNGSRPSATLGFKEECGKFNNFYSNLTNQRSFGGWKYPN